VLVIGSSQQGFVFQLDLVIISFELDLGAIS
jgi:hypothetical protein